jgi:hypothetical protein
MLYCRFCGSQAPDDARFCKNCGQALATPPIVPFSERSATGNVPSVQDTPQVGSVPSVQGTPSSLSPISVASTATKVTLSLAAKWIIIVASCAAIVVGGIKVLPIVLHGRSTSPTRPHPVSTTVPMPPTLTTCPPSGTARAAVVEPMLLGKDQNIVYIDNEGASDNPVSGSLKRYDVKAWFTMSVNQCDN